jgi:YcxB-like protein
MSAEIPNRVCITAQPTFGELFLGSLVVIRYQGWLVIFHAIFPLAGLFLLMTPLMGYRLGSVEILLAALGFSFTPLLTALGVWSARRRNKLAQGPFTYTFDTEGMHTSGSAFDQTIRWSAIPRIRLSKQFLFVFVAPATAHCIPLRSLKGPEELARLRNIAGEHTDFR